MDGLIVLQEMKKFLLFLALSVMALSSCDRSDTISESNDLKAMAGKNVVITVTHSVAVSTIALPSGAIDHKTAVFISGEFVSIDASGVILSRGGNLIWIERKLVISISADVAKNVTQDAEQAAP